MAKKAAWAVTVGATTPALVFGSPAAALADSFSTGGTTVGPEGASVYGVYTGVTEDGDVYYIEGRRSAGPDGITSEWTVSEAGSWE